MRYSQTRRTTELNQSNKCWKYQDNERDHQTAWSKPYMLKTFFMFVICRPVYNMFLLIHACFL